MKKIFDMDSGVIRFLSKMSDLIILNLVYVLCCIPIITIGAATTAMYAVTKKMVKNEESYIVRTFFKEFASNFKQSTIMYLILLVVMVISGFDVFVSNFMGEGFMPVFIRTAMIITFILAMVVMLYALTLQCTFENSVLYTMLNALILSITKLPYSITMMAISLSPVLVVLCFTKYLLFELLLMIVIWFSLSAYINSFMFNRIYEKFIEDNSEQNGDSLDMQTEEEVTGIHLEKK